MKKLNLPQLLVLNAYWVGLSFMWNALHPIILPAVLLNYVPDEKKNTYLGLLTFVGLMIAMVVQPLSGALSDGWKSRFGRRRPLIVFGTLFDFIFLSVLAWAGGLVWLFVGYIGLQLSSNIAHGPLQALLPDHVPQTQLGVASSLKTFMDMLSLVIASLLAGRLLDPITRDPTIIMLVVIGLLGCSAAITIFGVREEPAPAHERTDWKALFGQFRINFRENSSYWWLIAERALFLLGIYGVQAFAQYYLQDVLRVPDPPKQTGDLLAVLTISLVVLVLFGGWLTDKYGAKKILTAATLIAAVGIFLMVFATDMRGLFLFGSILGAGIGLFLTSNWALANSLAPEAEAGKFLGLTNLATAGSGALARLEGPALDWLNATQPGAWLGYKCLFIFGALCIFLSILLLQKISDNDEKNSLPSLQQIKELTAYLPRLYAEGFSPIDSWGGGEKLKDGSFSVPDPNYNSTVEEFFRVVAGSWLDYEYDPEQAYQMIQDENLIKTASLAQIQTMLTFCVRGERFSDGQWGEMIEKGYIRRLLVRLNEFKSELLE